MGQRRRPGGFRREESTKVSVPPRATGRRRKMGTLPTPPEKPQTRFRGKVRPSTRRCGSRIKDPQHLACEGNFSLGRPPNIEPRAGAPDRTPALHPPIKPPKLPASGFVVIICCVSGSPLDGPASAFPPAGKLDCQYRRGPVAARSLWQAWNRPKGREGRPRL